MKYYICALTLALALSCSLSAWATCRPDDSFVIRLNDEITVTTDPAMGWHDHYRYEAGTVCFTHFMGTVRELGQRPGWVLVQYTQSRKTTLRECPNRTEYLMTQAEWHNACHDDQQLRVQQTLRRLIKGEAHD